jgi:UDP-N-acetylmuramate dehydrogenase
MITLPSIRGRIAHRAMLAPATWFRVGGPAEFLVRPADVDDLAALMAGLPLDLPVTVIGAASNIIVRDGGIHGVVIRLARGFGDITRDGDGLIVGAAALDVTVAETAASQALTGLEFLSGIPGSIGGAVAMNAGAYGGDMAHVLDWAELVLRSGAVLRVSAAELGLTYRHAQLPPGAIVVRARLHARPGVPAAISAAMRDIKDKREASQPVRARTGGSTFANPPDMKAWELIDAAGCRGLSRGGAQVCELHCNFLLNHGHATAADLEGLGEEVRARVQATAGVDLRWEIKRIGVPA